MPSYDYKCECGEKTSINKKMKEATRKEYCEKCGKELQRVFDATPSKWNCSGAYVNS